MICRSNVENLISLSMFSRNIYNKFLLPYKNSYQTNTIQMEKNSEIEKEIILSIQSSDKGKPSFLEIKYSIWQT